MFQSRHDVATREVQQASVLDGLRQLISDLASKIDRLEQEVGQLRLDSSNLRRDNQALKDEVARLKNLPLRPSFKPSGMEKATSRGLPVRAGGLGVAPSAIG